MHTSLFAAADICSLAFLTHAYSKNGFHMIVFYFFYGYFKWAPVSPGHSSIFLNTWVCLQILCCTSQWNADLGTAVPVDGPFSALGQPRGPRNVFIFPTWLLLKIGYNTRYPMAKNRPFNFGRRWLANRLDGWVAPIDQRFLDSKLNL